MDPQDINIRFLNSTCIVINCAEQRAPPLHCVCAPYVRFCKRPHRLMCFVRHKHLAGKLQEVSMKKKMVKICTYERKCGTPFFEAILEGQRCVDVNV